MPPSITEDGGGVKSDLKKKKKMKIDPANDK